MPSLEQIGLPILIVGALVAFIGFLWLLRAAFKAGFFWGLLLILGSMVAIGGTIWLLQAAFEVQFFLGVAAVALTPFLLFMLLHRRRSWAPTVCILVGLGIIASPIAINWFVETFIPKGPREREVDGEIHLTLTGVKEVDYAYLKSKSNVNVLQMANPDVTDSTLRHLTEMTALVELDLNDTQITDEGLAIVAQLPALEKLRLRGTKITDAGFREHLFDKEQLSELDLTGTAVAGKTVRGWKNLKKGRKALQ
jgi:hypothetical protein